MRLIGNIGVWPVEGGTLSHIAVESRLNHEFGLRSVVTPRDHQRKAWDVSIRLDVIDEETGRRIEDILQQIGCTVRQN